MAREHAESAEAQDQQRPMTEEAIEAFLLEPRVAVLSWTTPKGDVASSPVWYEYRDRKFFVVSSSAYAKVRSMLRNPRVSFCIQDVDPPYRYVTVRAEAIVHVDPEAARELDARLARHYLGRTAGKYYTESMAQNYPGEPRLIELRPLRMSSFDGGAGMSATTLAAMKGIRAMGL